MPLSEHEERILAEIERQLEADDPRFMAPTKRVAGGTASRRRLIGAVVAFVLGFVCLLGLVFNPALAYVGFAVMFGAVLVGVPEIQRRVRLRAEAEAETDA